MQLPGRISAAIEILDEFQSRRIPLKTVISDWSRRSRFAGAKDRAWISGLCLDTLRRRSEIAHLMGAETGRSLIIGTLAQVWQMEASEITAALADEDHGAGAASLEEEESLARLAVGDHLAAPECLGRPEPPVPISGNYPEWLDIEIARVFCEKRASAMAHFAERADVDLRINSLKATEEKTMAALKSVKAEPSDILTGAVRIPAPPPTVRETPITVIPAFNKGWVEVQDLGSQIAAAAAGKVHGKQVLDFCAGGGGKTLALAAAMENKGQLYAYDIDARRLKPIYARAKRAGVRNLQVINPITDKDGLAALKGSMDLVFVDAPCTGSGTWRRHPDAKWRLTEKQLAKRREEQQTVLSEARTFVKPGGRLIYVTCSFLPSENEDQVHWFLDTHPEWKLIDTIEAITASGQLTEQGSTALASCKIDNGMLRLTPDKVRADAFFVACLAID
ncbi:MAG: RsmB/NOP family class I SAM-dependent RNA methyltransferase [Pseudomonadota bacterium]